MNDFAKLWVAELRSGKWKQATGQLRDGDNFCCLGVACELYRMRTPGAPEWSTRATGVYEYGGEAGVLPRAVQNALGFKTRSGEHNYSDSCAAAPFESLSGLNDRGSSFGQLADVIEANADELFV